MQGFLDAKRAINICITLCIKGFLRSRWSVEMTRLGVGLYGHLLYLSSRTLREDPKRDSFGCDQRS
jgi:hypothetical protein